jgi:hypothetical protein
VSVALFFLFGDGDGDIAAIFHFVAKRFQSRFETGDAHGGRAHIDAAARLAEVQGYADHPNLFRNNVGGTDGRHRVLRLGNFATGYFAIVQLNGWRFNRPITRSLNH